MYVACCSCCSSCGCCCHCQGSSNCSAGECTGSKSVPAPKAAAAPVAWVLALLEPSKDDAGSFAAPARPFFSAVADESHGKRLASVAPSVVHAWCFRMLFCWSKSSSSCYPNVKASNFCRATGGLIQEVNKRLWTQRPGANALTYIFYDAFRCKCCEVWVAVWM